MTSEKNEQGWTKEPWWYDRDTDHGSPIIFQGTPPEDRRSFKHWEATPVVGFHQADHESEAWFEVDDADGERIVTCVNALAGIADPAAAIEAAREALGACEGFLTRTIDRLDEGQRGCWAEDAEALRDITVRDALAQLGEVQG